MDVLKADTPKAKILVVDDEPNVLLTLTAILQHEGYEIESAKGGEEAIASVRRHHYDVVLTDLKMPRVDGLDVLDEVRRSSPQTVTLNSGQFTLTNPDTTTITGPGATLLSVSGNSTSRVFDVTSGASAWLTSTRLYRPDSVSSRRAVSVASLSCSRSW